MTQKRKIAKTDLPELLTRAELAELYGMSVKTLANWATMGIGPSLSSSAKRFATTPRMCGTI